MVGAMSATACLGAGRLVVLPPVVGAPTREVDVLAFGTNAWWTSTLQRLGRDTGAVVHRSDEGTPPFSSTPSCDPAIASTVSNPELAGRFARFAAYANPAGQPLVLVRARLFEARTALPTRTTGERMSPRLRDADLDPSSTA